MTKNGNTVGEWIDVDTAMPTNNEPVLILFEADEHLQRAAGRLPFSVGFYDISDDYPEYAVWGDLLLGDEAERYVVAWATVNIAPDLLTKVVPGAVSAQIQTVKSKIDAKRKASA